MVYPFNTVVVTRSAELAEELSGLSDRTRAHHHVSSFEALSENPHLFDVLFIDDDDENLTLSNDKEHLPSNLVYITETPTVKRAADLRDKGAMYVARPVKLKQLLRGVNDMFWDGALGSDKPDNSASTNPAANLSRDAIRKATGLDNPWVGPEIRAKLQSFEEVPRRIMLTGPSGSGRIYVAKALLDGLGLSGYRRLSSPLPPHELRSACKTDKTLVIENLTRWPIEDQMRLLDVLEKHPEVQVVTIVSDPKRHIAREGLCEELYYECSVLKLSVPSLADRKEELPTLFQRLVIDAAAIRDMQDYPALSQNGAQALQDSADELTYHELWQAARRAVAKSSSRLITEDAVNEMASQSQELHEIRIKHVPTYQPGKRAYEYVPAAKAQKNQALLDHFASNLPETPTVEELEVSYLQYYLKLKKDEGTSYHDIAKDLGMSKKTLWEKRKRYELDKEF